MIANVGNWLLWCLTVLSIYCTCRCGDAKTGGKMCNEVPETVLSEALGAAFNARYMSIKPPKQEVEDEATYKRDAGGPGSFYVDNKYAKPASDLVKWPWDAKQPPEGQLKVRRKRSASDSVPIPFGNPDQWHCKSKLRWIDLGPNYFPRYLRSVECLEEICWYTHFKCKPRSFTVKILRRKDNRCLVTKFGTHSGVEGLPLELKEMWMWEERAVNFCCDCSM